MAAVAGFEAEEERVKVLHAEQAVVSGQPPEVLDYSLAFLPALALLESD